MDKERFDDLARDLARQSASRRGVLGCLLGAAAVALGRDAASAGNGA